MASRLLVGKKKKEEQVTRKAAARSGKSNKKLKLRKITIRDLDTAGNARKVKGGAVLQDYGSDCGKTCKRTG